MRTGDAGPRAPRLHSLAVLAVVACVLPGCSIKSIVLGRMVDARPARHAVDIERDAPVPMPDGVVLVADLYRPREVERAPAILVRLPHVGSKAQREGADLIGRLLASRGYVVVFQATRGRWRSGGRYEPMLPERSDGIATLKWIESRPWYDGRIGMWGGSYFGYTQWVIADQRNPGPAALFVQNASTSFYDMFHPGGAFALASALYWSMRASRSDDLSPDHTLLQRGFDGVPLLEADDRAEHPSEFFDAWAAHATRDEYWARIDGEARPARLEAPILLLGGWFDPFLPGLLRDFEQIRRDARPDVAAQSRLIIGPWAHTYSVPWPGTRKSRDYRVEAVAPALDWFDRHLLGDPRRSVGSDSLPIRVFVMGPNRWKALRTWPPEGMRPTAFYLASAGNANSAAGGGVLLPSPPSGIAPPDTFLYDPARPVPTAGGAMLGPRAGVQLQNEIESRRDVLVYTSAALDEDLEICGPVALELHVTTSAPATDFTGKLVDVHPDGRAYGVCDGILRRNFDNGPDASSTPIRVDLWPTAAVFPKGHRVRLEVSSSNFPRFDRNPNTGTVVATETRTLVARQTVHHDATRPSRLLLPVLTR